jgi:hypothetical protein
MNKLEYRSFNDAKAFVHGLKLKNRGEWSEYCRSGVKPDDIPGSPNRVYSSQGWSGFSDWLGNGNAPKHPGGYRSFKQARSFAKTLKFRNVYEWNDFCKSDQKPKDIPAYPHKVYAQKGWKGMGDWLGTGNIANYQRTFRSFEDARAFVHTLNIRTYSEWVAYSKSGKKPSDIPVSPDHHYRGKGWKGYGDWLGTGKTINRYWGEYRSFIEARAFVQSLNLKGCKEWVEYCNSGQKPSDIPRAPEKKYAGHGWINWGDWTGKGAHYSTPRQFLPLDVARAFVHALNLKSVEQWYEYCKSGMRPADIPANPHLVYKDKGWKGYLDWLGK